MKLIGRKNEISLLELCTRSDRPEFLVVCGRYRIGKTYLVKEYFNHQFAFFSTGVAKGTSKQKLKYFYSSLTQYGDQNPAPPKDWLEAFMRLKTILSSDSVNRDPLTGKIVVFLDEMPWMDTYTSDFKGSLEFFWNSWASSNPDILLIVAGSATSWIINNLLKGTGGFYNRITRQINLKPFTLKEIEELCKTNNIPFTRKDIIDSYMIFGGVAHYYNLLDSRLSLVQNIDLLCFRENGQLHYEFNNLYETLFKNPEKHLAIVRALADKKSGLTRENLVKRKNIGDGKALTQSLLDLEQCGFIRKYQSYSDRKIWIYQLIDPFSLFHLQFMESGKVSSWQSFFSSPGFNAWRGLAFELVCLHHVQQIKAALNILAVDTHVYSFISSKSSPKVQIDLVLERADRVINICEIKYSAKPYSITESYRNKLVQKLETFREETGTDAALLLTMITLNGLVRNASMNSVANEITGDDLFT